MLDKIPSEILSHIGFHLSVDTLAPPVALLQTCRTVHDAISPVGNPRLYAKLFRSAFDLSAAERRIEEKRLHASHITAELRRRVRSLNRVRRLLDAENVNGVQLEDLWVIYIMLIENDGKNIKHFLDDGLVPLHGFLDDYQAQVLVPAALKPGYPKETTESALYMWIAWLISGYYAARNLHEEKVGERDERLFVLRPYVFAPQEYELCFAPWTIADLPIPQPASPSAEFHPFHADLTPKKRSVRMEHYGRELEISGPMLSHAAILQFFVKRSRDVAQKNNQVLLPMTAMLRQNAIHANGDVGIGRPQDPAPMNGTDNNDDDGYDSSDDGDETFGAIRDLVSNSRLHDRDFARLVSCHDPFTCRGMDRSQWRGSFEGCWEGNFSFFEFEAFGNMLNGNHRALYEGSFGEQAQVWRLTETWVWRGDFAAKKRRQRQREQQEKAMRRKEREEAGDVVTDEEETLDKGKKPIRRLPLNGPPTNAGFPTDLPPSTFAGLATAAAEAATLHDTIKQQVDAIEGYEIVPDTELDEALVSVVEDAGLEMILTGVGHSAWGRFILKGRVRAWDGLASLVKEYAVSPDSRGKWIYRGYVVSGDIFVGRWRDTFTPAEYVGYEGTFVLNRR